jgi:hypothetical protein
VIFGVELIATAVVRTKIRVEATSKDEARQQGLSQARQGDVVWTYGGLTEEPIETDGVSVVDSATIWRVDVEELSAILAGLRLIQGHVKDEGTDVLPEHISDILSNGGEDVPLDAEQIDDLCERLNHATEINIHGRGV